MDFKKDRKYMLRCLDLARLGEGNTATNPLVGSVIVYKGRIIGEGYHRKFGDSHAEVNAIRSVKNPELLKGSTLYVNLEPCVHHGKTPPCTDLITSLKIPRVVIGSIDTSVKVRGKGIEKLKKEGCSVKLGVLEDSCRDLNRRFFIFHEKKRPYIILKWAESEDGFIDKIRKKGSAGPNWITGPLTRSLVHKWRAEEQGILVGSNTARIDNPMLNVRDWIGENPVRIIINKTSDLPKDLYVFNQRISTILFTEKKIKARQNLEFVKINFNGDVINQIMEELYIREVQSILVEGGGKMLNSFIISNIWDEARVFKGRNMFIQGIKAPELKIQPFHVESYGGNELKIYRNL
ncbi:MAG: bifunctional diaminohydroxyphosphoribosylaminopyrimidine deaminase/5-amino-6-(5-phosphoribosylamino)uracil reductase RibD [Bacteroidales bacterium]|nr:bifunctional diaminohydroxyphosphoribosylaminopyrimidine deaminase/5-amino-6-(5-phosphoribosylamino)uracil reductase RibD [Bacteroidales bacterium]